MLKKDEIKILFIKSYLMFFFFKNTIVALENSGDQ